MLSTYMEKQANKHKTTATSRSRNSGYKTKTSIFAQQGLKPKPLKDKRSTSGLGIKRTSPFGRPPCYLWGLGQVPESFRVSAT
ncbi:uncharacterized protein [Macaca nemestrina]|uniref:uncharacterized protein isoform X5 n=1 Tax=Macaca nemestrina TaxID=9545 RepID=UPI0039B88E7E